MRRDSYRERDPRWARRAVQEFLAVPLAVVTTFVVAAIVSIFLDQ